MLNGADGFIFLGDYISDLADPVKTLDLVYEIQARYPTVCLRGNRERYMLDCETGAAVFSRGSKSGSLLYTFQQLRPQDLDFIKKLPIYDVIEINSVPIEIAHSTKDNDRYYFDGEDGRIQEIFPQMAYSCFLTGHSHKQYLQTCQGKTVINPGSIGVPMRSGSLAQYALLEVCEGAVHYEFRQVPYDVRAAIHNQFASGLTDYAKYWAISILYDIILGEECTITLLERVSQSGDVRDDALWRDIAADMGMRFTEEEILLFLRSHN